MAPGLAGFLDPSRNPSLIDGRPRPESPGSEEELSPDEMAMLEDTYQGSTIQVGEEVELFGKYLDDCVMSGGSPAEQRAKIFKLVDHYYEYTNERAEVLRERRRLERSACGGRSWQIPHSDDNSGQESNDMDLDEPQNRQLQPTEVGELQKWEEESQTWDLLRRLLPLRYRDKAPSQQPKRSESLLQSRRQYWADFLQSDPKAKERKAILEWLQTNASTGPGIDEVVEELQRNAERGEILAHGWLHTRGAVKQHKRLIASSEPLTPNPTDLADSKLDSPVKLVTQLDPDVMTRQKDRQLAPQDVFFEKAIWLGCFELLRRGRSMAEIRDWCFERTEIWRAAAISALPLANSEDEDVPNFDLYSTVLWRRLCFKLAREGGLDDYERAVYGILSGDVSSVEKVSKTWDDFTFAKYNAELRAQFDSYLVTQCEESAIQALGLLHAGVVGHLDSRELDRSRRAANTPSKSLQAAIIEDRLDKFLVDQGVVLAEHANEKRESKLLPKFDTTTTLSQKDKAHLIDLTNHDALRVLAHVLIIISALDKLDGKDSLGLGLLTTRHQTQEHIIAGYISFLRLGNLEELIPLYSSRLLGDRRYTNLCRNLIHVTDRDTQLRLLNLMQKLGLDVIKFVRYQPQIFLSEVMDIPGVCPAKANFSILQNSPPTLKYGRIINRGIFGPDSDEAEEEMLRDRADERLVRSMEWLLLVDELVLETCDFAVNIYKYFLKNRHLASARALSSRVPCAEIIRQKTGLGASAQEGTEPSWWDEVFSGSSERTDEDTFDDIDVSKELLAAYARPLWQLECLVNALDCLETTAMFTEAHRQNSSPTVDREAAKSIDHNTKLLKGFMKPLLKNWLLETVEGGTDYQDLRDAYLPDMIIAFISTLHFAGTTTSRDYLLECMNLSSVIADTESDLAEVILKAGRMKELVESFASCSKALAIWTSDMKKGAGASSKKLREMGWSRELWSIKQ